VTVGELGSAARSLGGGRTAGNGDRSHTERTQARTPVWIVGISKAPGPGVWQEATIRPRHDQANEMLNFQETSEGNRIFGSNRSATVTGKSDGTLRSGQ